MYLGIDFYTHLKHLILNKRIKNKWIEIKKTIAKINETNSRFFEKMNSVDKPLARLIKKKGRSLKSIELEMKKKIQLTLQEVQGIIRDYYKQLYANKMDNLEEMGKLLERYNLPRLNQEETENINRPVTNTETETVV